MQRPGSVKGLPRILSSHPRGLRLRVGVGAEAELTLRLLLPEGAMRASETVSEASPGSTASQTGVPTQVVQQVQGTQQVGHTPSQSQVGRAHEGGSGAVAKGTWPSLPGPLPEPSAYLSLSRCSLQLLLHPPGLVLVGKSLRLRAFLSAPRSGC